MSVGTLPKAKLPLVFNTSSKICITCGDPLNLSQGQIQLFHKECRTRGRQRGQHKKFYKHAYKI